jgi:preprotein translocase subunit SecA
MQVSDLYDPREQWASYVLNAVKAKELFVLNVSYIVRGGEVGTKTSACAGASALPAA